MIIWLVGLSGAGKTTIANDIYDLWSEQSPATVKVDGDIIRALTHHDKSEDNYSVEGRRRNAEVIFNVCNWLDQQNINVVCSVLCIFGDVLARNRQTFKNYYEVFLDAPMELVIERDVKGIYAPAVSGEAKNVVGIDIDFPAPENPDIVIQNTFKGDVREIAEHILSSALKSQHMSTNHSREDK